MKMKENESTSIKKDKNEESYDDFIIKIPNSDSKCINSHKRNKSTRNRKKYCSSERTRNKIKVNSFYF